MQGWSGIDGRITENVKIRLLMETLKVASRHVCKIKINLAFSEF